MRALRAAVTAAAIGVCVHAQAGPEKAPAFDAVSIKPAGSDALPGSGGAVFNVFGGRYRTAGIVAMDLIAKAFQTRATHVVGAPDWVSTAQYAITATLGGDVSPAAVRVRMPMLLRSMLEDRFRMKAHVESRPFSVYALVKARRDGRLGPNLRPSTCDGDGCKGGFFGGGRLESPRITMSAIAADLTNFMAERIVVDRTGLTGNFDVVLRWSPDQSDGVSIFTAIQEQLGLKLESRTEPLDAVVIDHIERPEPN